MSLIEQIEKGLNDIKDRISKIIKHSEEEYAKKFEEYEQIEGIDSEGGIFRILKGNLDNEYNLDYSNLYDKQRLIQDLISFYNQNSSVIDSFNQKFGQTLIGQDKVVTIDMLKKHENDLASLLRKIENDSNVEFSKLFESIDDQIILLKDNLEEYKRLIERKSSLEKLHRILIENKDVIEDYTSLMAMLDKLLENDDYIKIEVPSDENKQQESKETELRRVDRFSNKYDTTEVENNTHSEQPKEEIDNSASSLEETHEVAESSESVETPSYDFSSNYAVSKESPERAYLGTPVDENPQIIIDLDEIPIEEIVPKVFEEIESENAETPVQQGVDEQTSNNAYVENDPVLEQLMLNETRKKQERVIKRIKYDNNGNKELLIRKGILVKDFSKERTAPYKKYRVDISKLMKTMEQNDYLTTSGIITDLASKINHDMMLSEQERNRLLSKIQFVALKLENVRQYGMLSDSSRRGL